MAIGNAVISYRKGWLRRDKHDTGTGEEKSFLYTVRFFSWSTNYMDIRKMNKGKTNLTLYVREP